MTTPDSNLTTFAKDELQRAGFFDADADYDGELAHAVMRLIEVFSDEGHSGASAGMAIRLFNRLARFEPITPLTGEPDEWIEVGSGTLQNRRCSHVFMESGVAYDIDAPTRDAISFPYAPRSAP
jgi:hypothetical protein